MRNSFTAIVENVEAQRRLVTIQATTPKAARIPWQNAAAKEPTPYELATAAENALCDVLSWCQAMRLFAAGVDNTLRKEMIDFSGTIGALVDALENQLRDQGQLFHILAEMTATDSDVIHAPPFRESSFDPALHYSLETIFARHVQQLGDALEAHNKKCEIIDLLRSPHYLRDLVRAGELVTCNELSTIVSGWIAEGCPDAPGVLDGVLELARLDANSNAENGAAT